MSFFISSWDAHKVPLKQLTKWSFILALEQVCQRPIEILLSSLPVCYGYTTEQSQLKSALIFNRVLKLRLRIIRKDPSDSRDKAPTSALHWLFQELFAGLKVKFVTSHTHTNTHTHFLHSSQQQGRCRDCNFYSLALSQSFTPLTVPLSPPLPIPQLCHT